jgi:ribosomal protein S18 acetylase RimI-like enzyme
MNDALRLLQRLETQLHEALAEGSDTYETSRFRLHVWRTPDPFYRNVAVPLRSSEAWPPAVVELRALCERHERRPRVEFFAELWPDLEGALEEAGFIAEARAPVLVTEQAPPWAALGEAEIVALTGDAPLTLLRACLEGAAAAFHEPTAMLAPGELERLQEGLASGSLQSVTVLAGRVPASGASLAGRGPVAELLGVWTSPEHRRRGWARAACVHLLTRFFAAGGEVAWLTAASSAGLGLYRELGFRPCGTHLDYADPSTAVLAGQP